MLLVPKMEMKVRLLWYAKGGIVDQEKVLVAFEKFLVLA